MAKRKDETTRPVGRPRTDRGRGARVISGRLSPAESARIDSDAKRLGCSAFEVLRRAWRGEKAHR